MPESEHHPLLYDDPSDEEFQHNLYQQKRFRSGNRTLNKNSLNGAVVLLKRWPDYWSSIFLYWWTVVGMITITVLIIYNAILTFALMPTSNPIRRNNVTYSANGTNNNSVFPDVFMHIIVNHNGNMDRDLHKYLPYIDSVRSKYLEFNFNIVLVHNDTENKIHKIESAEMINDVALNSLWSGINYSKKTKIKNFVKHSTFSNIMDNSPLKKQWRSLPQEFIPFLIRAVSIWQKGGIAFDPIILAPQFLQSTYVHRIEAIYQLFSDTMKPIKSESLQSLHHNKNRKYKKRPNNIRDIIDALEKNDTIYVDHNLSEAENKVNEITTSKSGKLVSVKPKESNEDNNMAIIDKSNTIIIDFNDNQTQSSYLPMFFKFLFKKSDDHNVSLVTKDKYLKLPANIHNTVNNSTISKNYIYDKNKSDETLDIKLTVDLKGYVIATDTPCHAFIGSLFSDLIHYGKEETIMDFLIREISLFCKGNLSNCKGIDVILV